MANQHDEISFSQIFGVMKKSFKRAIIYVLASVILATALLFTLKQLSTSTSSTATISVTEASGITFEDVKFNKAIAVQRALERIEGLDNENEKLSSQILGNLSVTAIVPSNLELNTEFVPTSFTLTLGNLADISTAKQVEILDAIAIELVNSFGVSQLPTIETYNTLESDLLYLEYYQLADEIHSKATDVKNLITNQVAYTYKANEVKDPETGKYLVDVTNNLQSLLNRIEDEYKTFIISNNIQNANVNGLKNYINTQLIKASAATTAYTNMANDALEALKQFPSGLQSSGNSGNTYILDSAAYERLADDYYSLVNLQAISQSNVELYTKYLTQIDAATLAGAELQQIAKDKLTAICNDFNKEITTYKTLAEALEDEYVTTTQAKIVNPAYTINSTSFTFTTILIILVLVALVAYLVAFFQVFIKSRKAIVADTANELNTESNSASKE